MSFILDILKTLLDPLIEVLKKQIKRLLNWLIRKHPRILAAILSFFGLTVATGIYFREPLLRWWSGVTEIRLLLEQADKTYATEEALVVIGDYTRMKQRAQNFKGPDRLLYFWSLIGEADCLRRRGAGYAGKTDGPNPALLYREALQGLAELADKVDQNEIWQLEARANYGLAGIEYQEAVYHRSATKRILKSAEDGFKAARELYVRLKDPVGKIRVALGRAEMNRSEGDPKSALDALQDISKCRDEPIFGVVKSNLAGLETRDQVSFFQQCAKAYFEMGQDKQSTPEKEQSEEQKRENAVRIKMKIERIRELYNEAILIAGKMTDSTGLKCRIDYSNWLLSLNDKAAGKEACDMDIGNSADNVENPVFRLRWRIAKCQCARIKDDFDNAVREAQDGLEEADAAGEDTAHEYHNLQAFLASFLCERASSWENGGCQRRLPTGISIA